MTLSLSLGSNFWSPITKHATTNASNKYQYLILHFILCSIVDVHALPSDLLESLVAWRNSTEKSLSKPLYVFPPFPNLTFTSPSSKSKLKWEKQTLWYWVMKSFYQYQLWTWDQQLWAKFPWKLTNCPWWGVLWTQSALHLLTEAVLFLFIIIIIIIMCCEYLCCYV